MEGITAKTAMLWCKANMGAGRFLADLAIFESSKKQAKIYQKLKNCVSIRGINMHILYNDLCDLSLEKVYELCANCPDAELEQACSLYDCSGREMVEQYFSDEI